MKRYTVLMHRDTFLRGEAYRKVLEGKLNKAGNFLKDHLDGVHPGKLTTIEFIELLVRTKRPQIFAESALHGDGSDWSLIELSILGDISVSGPGLRTMASRQPRPVQWLP